MDFEVNIHTQYILKHRKPVACDDLMEWGVWFENKRNRRIRVTYINDIKISTVFLVVRPSIR